MINKVLIYGATGQCKMMQDIINKMPYFIDSVIDDTENIEKPFNVKNFICGKESYKKWKEKIKDYNKYHFVIAIGNPHGKIRKKLYEQLTNDGLKILDCIHNNSQINTKNIGVGLQIHSHAIINPYSTIGDYCIINTRALVEHDCILKDSVEIGPNATVCGEVEIGENTWIGAGATILPGIKIGKNVIVGAGSVVTKDIEDDIIVVGNPAKFLKNNNKYE